MKLRFSIRDLLLLTVIVALMIGWWIDHARLEKTTAVFQLMKFPNESTGLALAADDDALYRVVYPTFSTGGTAQAYRLTDGTLLWETDLQALGSVTHSLYKNEITILIYDSKLYVDGHETFGDYREELDVKTGKQVAHQVFPKPSN